MHGKELKELICASLLGDGSMSDKGSKNQVLFKVSHSKKQRDYCNWKMSLFNKFFEKHNIDKKLILHDRFQKVKYLDYPYPVSSFELRWSKFLPALYKDCYPFYRGQTKSYLYLLNQVYSPLHLAVWMGDDGNEDRGYSKSKVDQHKIPRSPRYRLAVCSMNEGEINLTVKWFEKHFDMTPRVNYANIKGKKYPILRFTVNQSERMFRLIKSYFSEIPSMRHKFRWSFEKWEIDETRNPSFNQDEGIVQV